MTSEDSSALVAYRMERAEESLEAAKIMHQNGMLGFAMNRIYYAMFYAVQAALILKDVSFSKHGQVKAFMNQHLIKTGIIPLAQGRVYNKAFEYRQKFDYVDFAEPNQELVEAYLTQGREFVEAIKQYLQDKKFSV
jgi:hypothetical protein